MKKPRIIDLKIQLAGFVLTGKEEPWKGFWKQLMRVLDGTHEEPPILPAKSKKK